VGCKVSRGSLVEQCHRETHEIKLSMEVSIGFVFSDLRNDAKPGVKASDVEGILFVVLGVWSLMSLNAAHGNRQETYQGVSA
jgi:hypothetical protein